MSRIFGISLTVPDLGAAVRFYREALGFDLERPPQPYPKAYGALLGLRDVVLHGAILRLGAQRIELLAFDPPGDPYPTDSVASDMWFQHCAIVVSDMAAAHAHVSAFAIGSITQGDPQLLPPNTGAVTAWKFRDPFGHPLELLHFPAGVGHTDWHRSHPPLFQGIDHTAIAVSDAAASTAFYARRFGFAVSSQTHNQGVEQSRLDGFEQADVDVVALSPADEPPHLELLAYRTGRRRPMSTRWTAADVVLARTLIETADWPAIPATTGSGQALPGPADEDGVKHLGRHVDPDGHVVISTR